jgi:hypothetical protein
MKQEKGFIALTVGRPQSGKSMFTGTLCRYLDPTFFDNMEERIVYEANDFMKILNKIKERGEIGRAIMWDEAGVGIPSRQWYDISNKAISFCIQVMGIYRPFIFFVTQDVSYIDSQPRKLINTLFEVSRSNKKYSRVKSYNIAVDRRRGKAYYRYPLMRTQDKMELIIEGFKFTKPCKEFIDRYLRHSEPYKNKITKLMEHRTENFDAEVMKKTEWTTREMIEKILSEPENYKGSKPGRLNAALIQYGFNVPVTMANAVKARTEQIMARDKKNLEVENEKTMV